MTTAEEVKSADEVSAILEQAYYELATETRLARVGLKERQETAPIVERYRYLYTRPQIEAVRAEMEAATGERREELARLHSALLDGYIDTRVATLDAEVIGHLLAATRRLYEQHVPAWVQDEIGRPLDGLSCAHFYWLRRNQVPAHLFPAEQMVQTLRRSLRGMGIDLDQQPNIHIDAEDRPSKNPRACVIGARIPGEVHLIIKPTGGKGDYDAFFHEAGHAEHFANTDPALPFAFRRLSVSMAQAELFSYLMENLVNDPAWLQTYMGHTRQQAAFVAYRAALTDLILLRRYGAKYLYEYAYFSAGGDGPALYAEGLLRHTGFAYPAAFWQYDRDPGFYSADYLRAWFGHAQVVSALRERYGPRWWADPQAGDVVRNLWRAGVRPEIEDVVRELGGTPWDTDALVHYYEQRLAYGARAP